ncbi:hypothetical protein QT381_02605 [Galbitalea sp. SE-J8]|uniref:terminase small subunit n=1 Tax=Galbitalea sp. SE-J8 TaxID=3054952 RepID=UPI00259CFF75|nr:hypothetical protein [Galbitalea sp. SE-J8]MDM4761894.1 hypothetical protein [Galbitalea sp. SE-J8]
MVALNLVEALERAVKAAKHLDADGKDAAAIEALRGLARKADAWDQIVDWAIEDASEREGARPAVPANDNVTLAIFFKACDQLGLTPSGRKAIDLKEAKAGGKLANLRDQGTGP